jgi:hypothetical protein
VAGSVGTGSPRTPFGISLAAGAAVMVAGAMVAAGLAGDVPGRLAVVALALGGYVALVDDVRAGLATAGLGYLLFDGFLVNRYGELTWDGTTTIWCLVAFVMIVGGGLGIRWIRRARARTANEDDLSRLLNGVEHER